MATRTHRRLPAIAVRTCLLAGVVAIGVPGIALPGIATATAPTFPGGIAITEILANVANEATDETVEFINVGSATVDLAGWQLADDGTSPQTVVAYPRTLAIGRSRTTLAPGQVALLLDKDYVGGYDAAVTASVDPDDLTLLSTTGGNPGLTNAADRVIIRAADGTVSDDFKWTSDAGEGASIARKKLADGTLSALAVDAGGKTPGFIRADAALPVDPPAAPSVRLSELLPDPVGSDDAEFIEVETLGTTPADATTLALRDASGTSFTLHGTLTPGSLTTFVRTASGITLNNDGDTVSLVWTPTGQPEQVLDAVSYGKATEGQSFARFTSGFAWTTTPTSGTANVLTAPAPTAKPATTPSDVVPETGTDTPSDTADTTSLDSLAKLAAADDGDQVSVEGSVVTLPGVLHSTGFYVVDKSAGVLIVPAAGSDRAWLESVDVGDQGTFTGSVEHSATGIRLVLDAAPELTHGKAAKPITLALSKLGTKDVGRLVAVKGSVSRRSGKSFRIADGHAEVLVSVRKTTGITKLAPAKGAAVSVAGIVLASSSGVVVAPRSTTDLAAGAATVKNTRVTARTKGALLKTGTDTVPLLYVPPLGVAALATTALRRKRTSRARRRRRAAGSGRSGSA